MPEHRLRGVTKVADKIERTEGIGIIAAETVLLRPHCTASTLSDWRLVSLANNSLSRQDIFLR